MNGVRTSEKKLRKSLTTQSKDEAAKGLTEFMSTIAKAAQKGRIKKATASRKISRLSRQVASLA